jgi:hypothetical protein
MPCVRAASTSAPSARRIARGANPKPASTRMTPGAGRETTGSAVPEHCPAASVATYPGMRNRPCDGQASRSAAVTVQAMASACAAANPWRSSAAPASA